MKKIMLTVTFAVITSLTNNKIKNNDKRTVY